MHDRTRKRQSNGTVDAVYVLDNFVVHEYETISPQSSILVKDHQVRMAVRIFQRQANAQLLSVPVDTSVHLVSLDLWGEVGTADVQKMKPSDQIPNLTLTPHLFFLFRPHFAQAMTRHFPFVWPGLLITSYEAADWPSVRTQEAPLSSLRHRRHRSSTATQPQMSINRQ